MSVTLSDFYPEGTAYFYGYPAGQDSGFFNTVPPEIEELVAGRPLRICGDKVKVVTFADAVRSDVRSLFRDIGTPLPSEDRIITFPDDINAGLSGSVRNDRIRSSIKNCVQKGSLSMAQPYTGADIEDRYLLPASLSVALNDKSGMAQIIPGQYLAPRFAQFTDGARFAASDFAELPCVVKVAGSSAGDGVRICRNAKQLARARRDFAAITQPILIEQFIAATDSIGVQFAVPFDADRPPQVLGCSRQCLTGGSESVGGLVETDPQVPARIERVLLESILPKLQLRGWYGIGGMDVLVVSQDEFYFVDPNFRMTAMTPFVWQARSGDVGGKRQLSFNSALFEGKYSDVIDGAAVDSQRRLLNIVSAVRCESGFRLCGSVLFDQQETLAENIAELRAKGLKASSLAAHS